MAEHRATGLVDNMVSSNKDTASNVIDTHDRDEGTRDE